MKTILLKSLIAALTVLFSLSANAYDVEVDGIYYNLVSKAKSAEVASGTNKYKGDVVIPSSILYNDETYSVTSIGSKVFYDCSGLVSITIPNSVTSIGSSAFYGCKGLTSITIPSSVTTIGYYAFYGCKGLTSITIPNSVTSIEYSAFEGCSGLTSITISSSVTSIGYSVFKYCRSLSSITIPNSVTSIESSAFDNCSGLTSITIPNSVTSIGTNSFDHCKNITDVYSYADIPSISSYSFKDAYIEYATLHVPVASINSYKSDAVWGKFGKIISLTDEEPEPELEIKKCETPTIAYVNGELQFSSATKGAEFTSQITDDDIKKYYDSSIKLTKTYLVSVVATLSGYEESEVSTATLTWIEFEPTNQDVSNSVTEIKSYPVLIQAKNGQFTVQGAGDNVKVAVYSAAGTEEGSATSKDGSVVISTSLQKGDVAIVKIGGQSIKILMK